MWSTHIFTVTTPDGPLPVFFLSSSSLVLIHLFSRRSDVCQTLVPVSYRTSLRKKDRELQETGGRVDTGLTSGPVQVHLPQIPLIHRITSHLSEIWTINQEAVHVSETETQSD
ncbi:uncharacterized [Lates japonicus]